jgi:predicted alpha/beta-hydrolase family hydrolase
VQQTIATPFGDGRLDSYRARRPVASLLLSHGAGRGVDTRDLEALAAALPRQGVHVHLFEQPWRVKGGKVASPPATLDIGFSTAARSLRGRVPFVVGGRSAGARSAARTASALGATGCLALAFPLHPPGRPEKSRLDELLGAGVPTLVVQGENDSFGRPDEFPGDVDLAVVPSADHGFATPKRSGVSEAEAMEVVVESVLEWIVREVTGNP